MPGTIENCELAREILVFGILAGLTHLAHGLVSFVGSLFRMRRIGFYQADGSYEEFRAKLKELGETPIPKYIDRRPNAEDEERYQTIFAKVEGAVAAPTGGLHFDKNLMKRLEIKGIDFAELTLHVGLGTFRPVEVEDLSKHKMDSEQYWIYEDTARKVNAAKKNKQVSRLQDRAFRERLF